MVLRFYGFTSNTTITVGNCNYNIIYPQFQFQSQIALYILSSNCSIHLALTLPYLLYPHDTPKTLLKMGWFDSANASDSGHSRHSSSHHHKKHHSSSHSTHHPNHSSVSGFLGAGASPGRERSRSRTRSTIGSIFGAGDAKHNSSRSSFFGEFALLRFLLPFLPFIHPSLLSYFTSASSKRVSYHSLLLQAPKNKHYHPSPVPPPPYITKSIQCNQSIDQLANTNLPHPLLQAAPPPTTNAHHAPISSGACTRNCVNSYEISYTT